MERTSSSSSYEYRANVKAKVKQLESTMLNPEDEAGTSGSRRKKDPSDNNYNVSMDKDSENVDEKPAVMDVETMQINSTPKTFVDTTLKNSIPASINSSQAAHQQQVPEHEATATVSVKGLLKKFSNGVVSASQPFRRKSSVSSNDLAIVGALHSSDRVSSKQPTSMNKTTKPMTKTNSENSTFNSGFLINKTFKITNHNSTTPAQLISSKTSIQTSIVRPVTIDKGDQAETQPFKSSVHNQLFKKSDLTSSGIENQQQSLGSEFNASNVHAQPSPKPKPRVRVVIPTSNSTANAKVLNPYNVPCILIIGPGRAGKSSVVNFLLRQDLLPIHKQKPLTREILELTAKVKVIDNSTDLSSIRIIDTPGFENKDEDASLFSTLISHLDDNDGLQGKSPTLVIVTLGYETWKKPSYSENLINFLKVVSHFHQNFFDASGYNFLFVVSHSTPSNVEKFQDLSIDLSTIIRQHTSITEPLIVFHGINQNHNSNKIDYNLDENSGNLASTIKSLLKLKYSQARSAQHMVMNMAFGDDYPQSIQECFISKRLPLRSSEHPEVMKTQKSLQYIYLNIEPTEISMLLEIGWENVDSKLRQNNPSSLLTLQQLFQKHQIRSFSELPEEPLKVLDILRQIPNHNLAVTDLLTETLQLRIPSCYPALFVGQGYDVSKDSVTHVSPFQFSGKLNTSPVGLIPEEMNCKVTNDREIVFKFYYSFEDYVLERMKDLSLTHVTFPTSTQTVAPDQKTGYNIVKPNQEPTKTTTAKAMIEYRVFQLALCGREDNLMEFKPQFWDTASTLPDLDIKKLDTIDAWKEFFNYWGTHVIKSAFGGGSVQVNFRGKMLSNIFKSLKQDSILPLDEYETSKVFQWITGDGLDFVTTNDDSKAEFLQGFDVDTCFQGGDMKFQQMDMTKLSHQKVSAVRDEWIQSLPLNPVILETNLTLVPLSYFVREKSEGIATKMDIAFHYFYSNFMASQGNQSSCSIL